MSHPIPRGFEPNEDGRYVNDEGTRWDPATNTFTAGASSRYTDPNYRPDPIELLSNENQLVRSRLAAPPRNDASPRGPNPREREEQLVATAEERSRRHEEQKADRARDQARVGESLSDRVNKASAEYARRLQATRRAGERPLSPDAKQVEW